MYNTLLATDSLSLPSCPLLIPPPPAQYYRPTLSASSNTLALPTNPLNPSCKNS
jgi:hypothetical protein